ncbi:MAG TPA: VOC family protein [Candidatus Dormibacteraeota bacterium]|jgi:lactoylglutathione lyase|nr:VOC family protein [Candidatus Dormibacteraeota bacterium]
MSAPRLGYVVRFTQSLDAVVHFYEHVLRQRLVKRTEHWAQFDCGGVTFGVYDRDTMAATLDMTPAELGSPPGAMELAFEVEDCDAAHDEAVRAGARSLRAPADRPWGERTSYLLDPDGALVELYSRPRRPAASTVDTTAQGGADQGEAARREEMATPSSESGQLGDPND